jgi:hypothetical protein
MPEENITIDDYSYYTRWQGGAEKNSENYLLDMLQVVVHIQIKNSTMYCQQIHASGSSSNTYNS